MRDRLIELVKQRLPYGVSVGAKFEQRFCEKVADYLLANGVIVPPCKIGDKVYYLANECDNCYEQDDYCYPRFYTAVQSHRLQEDSRQLSHKNVVQISPQH